VIVGLGNPYRTDDGVGIAILRALQAVIRDPLPVIHDDVVFMESAHGGLPLVQALVGYRRALLVDAAPFLPLGELFLLPIPPHPDPPPSRGRGGCTPALGGRGLGEGGNWLHGLGLAEALELLAAAGEDIPEVWALGVGVPGDPPFGEELSAEVAAAVPKAVVEVENWLRAGF
jgi:Ni,Fe-hydrogenase maturation factor